MAFANEIWLAIRTDVADGAASNSPGGPPPGSPGNPYAAITAESFANIMRLNIQHVVQTVEMLQAAVRQLQEHGGAEVSNNGHRRGTVPEPEPAEPAASGGTIVAEVAEQIFKDRLA